jgi:hypothetical protein
MMNRPGLVTAMAIALGASCTTETQPSSSPPPDPGGDVPASAAHVETCRPTCSSAADCAIPGTALGDQTHFACVHNRCEWRGCRSNTECTSALQVANTVCETPPGGRVADCVATCNTADDCAVPDQPLNDKTHYACVANRCKWQGCQNTQECSAALHSSKVVCEKAADAPVASCQPTCASAADCAIPGQPLSDAGHFACVRSRCEWKGCKSTDECKSALGSSRLVCE